MKIPDTLPKVGSSIVLTKPIRPANHKKFNLEGELPVGLELKVLGNGFWNPYSISKNWYLVQVVGEKQKWLLNPSGLLNAYKEV